MNEELKSGLMVRCCVQPLEMEEKTSPMTSWKRGEEKGALQENCEDW